MVTYVFECACGKTTMRPMRPLADARKYARSLGWTNPERGVDRCPDCSEVARKKAAEHPGYY